ncbi:uncharacterized protein BJ171DRAFT_509363 [Polychytrium aggregatum]|uniref:uncharacterized protein n=1 Tax=Polychytrium aggregatum TaxID=110093 RepID=UPI0022FDE6A0|nr:uncharacterized protein BJ171DRAFT_509363 [Polychytrium aggregatum]KAI9203698.1 hypothetical protein BJ171DRAFT_509363 [Polychytrium aggregatum]
MLVHVVICCGWWWVLCDVQPPALSLVYRVSIILGGSIAGRSAAVDQDAPGRFQMTATSLAPMASLDLSNRHGGLSYESASLRSTSQPEQVSELLAPPMPTTAVTIASTTAVKIASTIPMMPMLVLMNWTCLMDLRAALQNHTRSQGSILVVGAVGTDRWRWQNQHSAE